MLYNYIPLFLFFTVCFLISLVVFLASYFATRISSDKEKTSSYECGFEPFNDARKKIDVRFYLVAILFIIFDLEIAYLFPWALDNYNLSYDGIISLFFFLLVLTLGFIFEWKKGALEWE